MKDIFHSAALKLTIWYLAIIMVLSVITSLALYNVSSGDLNRSAHRQVGYFNTFLTPGDVNKYSLQRMRQLDEDRAHLKGNLVLFNLIVLIFGGVVSYGLARRTMQPIEETLESQKRFTADASHELRTPLTAIITENEVALRSRGLGKKEAINLLKSNLEEATKLKTLADGLLKLANGDNDQFDQPVGLRDVAEQAVERTAKVALAKKIVVHSSVQNTAVKGDPERLVDLIVILLDNAVKYSPRGATVDLSSRAKSKQVLVSVSDSGQGIAVTDLPHIFERFYRADGSRNKQKTDGYGLGLAIAKKIVDLHQGSIEVKSAPGKGSTFIIRLPQI